MELERELFKTSLSQSGKPLSLPGRAPQAAHLAQAIKSNSCLVHNSQPPVITGGEERCVQLNACLGQTIELEHFAASMRDER